MSKVLVLSGSPRKNGNTERLAAAFAEGAGQHHDVEILSVCDFHIEPCIGCNTCFKGENRCFREDDMELFYKKLKEAEILIIASPVYFYGISAQLKTVIDRLHNPIRNSFHIKKLGLILVGGASLPDLFDSIIEQSRLVRNFFHLEDAGMVLVRGAREKGEVPEASLKEAYELGASLH